MAELQIIHVAIATSDDLGRERDLLTDAIEDVNQSLRERGIALHLKPTPSNPDILVAVLWNRLDSETEEHLRRVVTGQRLYGPRYVIVFFNQELHEPTDE